MSGLRRRLERLEAPEKPPERDEDAERRAWLVMAEFRRAHENRDPDESVAGDLLRLFRTQGELEGGAFERARGMVLAWPTSPPSPSATGRVLSRMVHDAEPGTEGMECPADWREAWEAADGLRERHAAVPVETLAGWLVAQHGHEREGGGGDAPGVAAEADGHGLTEELYRAALGPDADGLDEGEEARRLREILAGDHYGERAWRIQRRIHRPAGGGWTRTPPERRAVAGMGRLGLLADIGKRSQVGLGALPSLGLGLEDLAAQLGDNRRCVPSTNRGPPEKPTLKKRQPTKRHSLTSIPPRRRAPLPGGATAPPGRPTRRARREAVASGPAPAHTDERGRLVGG